MTIPNTADVKAIAKRIGALLDQQKDITDSLKDIYAEAKSSGIDTKALKAAIAIARKDQDNVHLAKINQYLEQMNLFPLFDLGE